MSDILRRWLGTEVGLEVGNVEQDFANGYLFGQLFERYNLQPDFEKFEPQRTPDAMINNFTRLQPTFKKLDIHMDTRTANSLMREEAGVALRLLYSIKQKLGSLNIDLQKFQHTGRLGKDYGVATNPNSVFLEAQKFNTQKEKYTAGIHTLFEDVMRARADNPNALMESIHLKGFYDEQTRQQRRAMQQDSKERHLHAENRSMFRTAQLEGMKSARGDKVKKLQHDDAVHAALMKRKEELEKEELRVELALTEKSRRKKLEGLHHASLDVTHGIDAFEINLKRLVKGEGDEDGIAPGTATTTRNPMEHMNRIRSLATSSGKLLEDSQLYMSTIKAQRQDDLASKKEREARRRKLVVEQQAAAAEAERKAQVDSLLATLQRQSQEEQTLAERMWQLNREKDVMVENRQLREQQYAERREKDWEETLRREMELHRSMREQYEKEAQLEMQVWHQAQEERAKAKRAKHEDMCRGIAWQLVMLAERAVEYRSTTGALVPRREYRQWLAMFMKGDPALGDPVVAPEPPPEPDLGLAKALVEDYLDCVGDFDRGEEGPIGFNAPLGKVVADLADLCRPHILPEDLPQLDMPLRVAVVGAPFSGKTSVAQELARKLRLRVLSPEAVVADALKEAADWQSIMAQGGPAAVAAAAAAAAAGGKPGSPAKGSPAKPSTPAPAAEPVADGAEAEPPQPGPKAAMGLMLREALDEGKDLPDEALVRLMVIAMDETKTWTPPPELDAKGKPKPKPPAPKGQPPVQEKPQGFVIDGFPRTRAQAEMMEKALTGLDLESEKQVIDTASRLAPPPQEAVPHLDRPLMSGLDAVVSLGLMEDNVAVKRALGRRLDPQTGRIYHLEFDPPPANDPGLSGRLQEVKDDSNDAMQIQHRLTAYSATAAELDDWLKRFAKLRRPIEGSGQLPEVLASASDVANSILRAKAAVMSGRAAADSAYKAKASAEKALEFSQLAQAHAEAAARELLQAKKAEIQATALLQSGKNPDPAATEVLKAQAAAKCAEQLKSCRGSATDAANYAERAQTAATTANDAAERARMSLGDAEVSAHAEIEARTAAEEAEKASVAAAEAAKKAEIAKAAAEVAVREADKFSAVTEVAPDAKVELAPAPEPEVVAAPDPAAEAPPQVPIPSALAQALHDEWQSLEGCYLEGLAYGYANLSEQHQLCLQHFVDVRARFKALLERPDSRSAMVTKFQQEFNGIDIDVRRLKETQAELILRAEELRDALWAVSDKKMEEAEAERSRVANDSFVTDHTTLLGQHMLALAQVEVDRFVATINFLKGYTQAQYGVLKEGPAEPEFSAPDLLNGQVPPEVKDRVDEKSKTVMQFPPAVTALQAKTPNLALGLKVALASASNLLTTLQPAPEDPKKAKKEAAKPKGKKGADEEPPEEKLDPKVEEAINASLLAVAEREAAILNQRLLLLAGRAATYVEEVGGLATGTVEKLGQWVKQRFTAECSAVSALDKVIKEAAFKCTTLPADLQLGDETLVVDEASLLLPPPQALAPPEAREKQPPGGLLSTQQLAMLTEVLQGAAASGFIKLGDAADLMCRAAAQGILPDGWRAARMVQMLGSMRMFDPTNSGYMDWRELLACLVCAAFPIVAEASCADMADQVDMLSEADADKDGLVTEPEWMGVELWFQYKSFTPGSEDDLEASSAPAGLEGKEGPNAAPPPKSAEFDTMSSLKKVLWTAFSSAPEGGDGLPRMDFRAVLLYLCCDRDMFSGIKKAVSVASGSIAANARATAEQLYKLVYPLGSEAGQAIHRSLFTLEDVQGVVKAVYSSRGGDPKATPCISAEQLMYSTFGERLLNQALGRYQWKDAYIATKL